MNIVMSLQIQLSMKLLLSLVLFFFQGISFSCEIKEKKLLFLSSPISLLAEELGILKSPKILGVSSYHPLKEYDGPKVLGGIYLSSKNRNQFKGSVIFYDESFELEKSLKKFEVEKLIALKSKGRDPFIVLTESLDLLLPYLEGCDEKIKKIKEFSNLVNDKLKSLNERKLLFFLGALEQNLFPPLLINNDLFVKALKDQGKLKTYGGEIAYIHFSEKELRKFHRYLFVGLSESQSDVILVERLGKGKINLSYRGIFSPGIRQITFLHELMKVYDEL